VASLPVVNITVPQWRVWLAILAIRLVCRPLVWAGLSPIAFALSEQLIEFIVRGVRIL
jgi:hypothetical protein